MDDELRRRVERVAGIWENELVSLKRIRAMGLDHYSHNMPLDFMKALDALVDAMPDPRERLIEAALRVDRNFKGRALRSDVHLIDVHMGKDAWYEFEKAIKAYKGEAPEKKSDPQHELCEAALALADKIKGKSFRLVTLQVDDYTTTEGEQSDELARLCVAAQAYKRTLNK